MNENATSLVAPSLLREIVCPHCWHRFEPDNAVWIATHGDLYGDDKLGDDAMRRFLPTRFNVDGDALDPKGGVATATACPRCHLRIPRRQFELPTLIFSILGAPGSGKSYLLASMLWQTRQILPTQFHLSFADSDATMNARLIEYEERQFLANDPDRLTWLAKTEEQGDLYDRVRIDERTINLPKPFLFNIGPTSQHPHADRASGLSRVLCLYDNAGESFLPGADETLGPVTGHLGQSEALFFCFDPTQDPRFRSACSGLSSDPQMVQARTSDRESSPGRTGATSRQDTILTEAISRVRRGAGLREDQKIRGMLLVLVTKWDAWEYLLPGIDPHPPYASIGPGRMGIDEARIKSVSDAVQSLLQRTCAEMVSAAQAISDTVLFMPVSATGVSPEVDPESGQLGVRPRDLRPRWAEVPMLMAIARRTRGLIDLGKPK
ncbi:hypothetical protein NHH03_06525 [Stieleria sp. TO1_6]|uniref:hypothetical protein n=1 Tax=Stieleria tagensis TaxID=2956795 RepID=UPI00209B683E|nr:hypothetical protein [Stieleria tagensis]MCO8121386.1 hypothetical protein [Stieleria tagensis]